MISEATISKVQVRRELPNGATLKALRLAAGLSQADVAREVGCSSAAISHYETGRSRPRPDVARRYLDVIKLVAEL